MVIVFAGGALDNTWSTDQVVGTWRSTKPAATLVFYSDGTFEATDVPTGRDATSCDPTTFPVKDYVGDWYTKDVGDFVHIDFWDQIWKGRTAKGEVTLRLFLLRTTGEAVTGLDPRYDFGDGCLDPVEIGAGLEAGHYTSCG
jgi:hypothetical protein